MTSVPEAFTIEDDERDDAFNDELHTSPHRDGDDSWQSQESSVTGRGLTDNTAHNELNYRKAKHYTEFQKL